MPKGTEVAVQEESTDVLSPEELASLRAQQDQEFDNDLLQTPILKIGQGLTREVVEGDAEQGEFIDTLRGEGLGKNVGFIVSYYQRGRFAADRETGRAYVAFGSTIPEAWADLVGEEFVGTPFAEHPDAEETYKARVNAKEIEWGKGPLISTTHNFTGLAVVPAVEGSDEPDELRPVRLSLQRTNMESVRKWVSLLRSLRNRPYWDVVFDLGTAPKSFKKGTAHLLTVKQGRKTTAEEKSEAATLAQAVAAGRTVDNSAGGEDAPAPEATGGIAVS